MRTPVSAVHQRSRASDVVARGGGAASPTNLLRTRPSSSPSTAGMGTQSKSPRACFRPQHAAAGVITLVPYLARALSNRPPGIRPPCPDPTASPRHLQAGHGNRSGVSVQKALVEQIQQKFLSIRTAVGHTHVSSSREKPPVPSFFQTPEGLTTVCGLCVGIRRRPLLPTRRVMANAPQNLLHTYTTVARTGAFLRSYSNACRGVTRKAWEGLDRAR